MNISVVFLTVTALSLTACMGDKTMDDYRADKARQQLSKIKDIEGNYKGNISSVRDHSALGTLSIRMEGNTKVQNSADNLSSEQKAVVRGTITFQGGIHASVNFDEGYYDEQNQVMQAQIRLSDETNSPSQMMIYGSISGRDFIGGIEADGFPEYGGTFHLIKDGPSPSSEGLISSRVQELLSTNNRVFNGKYHRFSEPSSNSNALTHSVNNRSDSPTPEGNFQLSIIGRETRPEHMLLNIFRPTRSVLAHCYFQSARDPDIQTEASLSNVQIDDRTHKLIGTGMVRGYEATLQCDGNIVGNSISAWNCTFSGSGKSTIQAENLLPTGAVPGRRH